MPFGKGAALVVGGPKGVTATGVHNEIIRKGQSKGPVSMEILLRVMSRGACERAMECGSPGSNGAVSTPTSPGRERARKGGEAG